MNSQCPICDGEGVVLGALGKLIWFRCCNCGMDFHRSEPDDNRREQRGATQAQLAYRRRALQREMG